MADPLGVSLAFDAPPMEPDPVWTRIDTLAGCRVREWQIDRGRPTEFDKTGTGTAVIRIVDRQGLFDPTGSSSYATKIVPGKQAAIALQNPVNDTWHTLFRGFIESWTYRLDQTRQYMELELQLVDGFAILARAELRVGVDGALPPFDGFPDDQKVALNELAAGNVLYGETVGTLADRMMAILGDVGWPYNLSVPWDDLVLPPDVFSGNVRVGPKAYGPGTSALDALWDAADGEFWGVANIWMSKEGHVSFRGRQARFRPGVAEYRIATYDVGDPSLLATLDPEDFVPLAELEWVYGQDNIYNSVTATPEKTGRGSYVRPLDPSVDDVNGQLVKDDVSIGAYGLRSLTLDNLQTLIGIETDSNSMVETKKMATYYVENYKDPQPRISRMVFKTKRPSAASSKLWEFFCNCEISSLLTLKTAHPGTGGFNTDFYVEGIHYTGRPGNPDIPVLIELSLDVSPRAHWTTNPFTEDPDP